MHSVESPGPADGASDLSGRDCGESAIVTPVLAGDITGKRRGNIDVDRGSKVLRGCPMMDHAARPPDVKPGSRRFWAIIVGWHFREHGGSRPLPGWRCKCLQQIGLSIAQRGRWMQHG